MTNFIRFLLISSLIPNNLWASESLNKKHFFLEIESLNIVMRYEQFKNPYIDKNNENKYQALRLDECNCLVKVKKNRRLRLFYVDICNKKFSNPF